MRLMRKGLVVMGALALAGTLVAGVAIAKPKCPKQCNKQFAQTKKDCVAACRELSDRPSKKACKKACASDLKASKTACKLAQPTFPACSPSGAFVD